MTRIHLLPLLPLVIAAPLLLAACGSGGNSIELTFSPAFENREAETTGSAGSDVASTTAGHGALLDEAGKKIGTFNVTSIVTRKGAKSESRLINAEYGFGADRIDSILISGSEEFAVPTGLPFLHDQLHYAVIGGTGAYAGAVGECLVKRRGKNAFTTTCTFTTP
jgi:hypothetical protein